MPLPSAIPPSCGPVTLGSRFQPTHPLRRRRLKMKITRIIPVMAILASAACGAVRKGPAAENPDGKLPLVAIAAEGLAEDIQADLEIHAWRGARGKLAQLQDNFPALRGAVLKDR